MRVVTGASVGVRATTKAAVYELVVRGGGRCCWTSVRLSETCIEVALDSPPNVPNTSNDWMRKLMESVREDLSEKDVPSASMKVYTSFVSTTSPVNGSTDRNSNGFAHQVRSDSTLADRWYTRRCNDDFPVPSFPIHPCLLPTLSPVASCTLHEQTHFLQKFRWRSLLKEILDYSLKNFLKQIVTRVSVHKAKGWVEKSVGVRRRRDLQ